MRSEIPHITTWNFVLWVVRRRRRWRIVGNSMLPLLQPDEEVLVDRNAYQRVHPAVQDIVVLQYPDQLSKTLIKRVVAIDDRGYYFVEGDNRKESTDSRSFGWVPPDLILGRVVSRFDGAIDEL